MARSIFFSYAREDRSCVEWLARSLRTAGFEAFFDADITGGQQWWDQLLTQIEECEVFVPVLSPAYLRSVPCRLEVSYAVELGKNLVPLDLGAGNDYGAAFIEPIKSAQWISFDAAEPTTTVLSMIGSLNSTAPAPSPPPGIERPAAPGADVMATTVRLVATSKNLTATEQWAVVGELRAHLQGEHSGSARTLLESFMERNDLLVSVYNDAKSMTAESPAPPTSLPKTHPRSLYKRSPARRPPGPSTGPNSRDQDPKDYTVVSAIMGVIGIFSFGVASVFGIVALFYSRRAATMLRAGDGVEARRASRLALRWIWISVAVLAGFLVIVAMQSAIVNSGS